MRDIFSVDSIAIEVTSKAFLPEAYAYRDYFVRKGFKCDFIIKNVSDPSDYDAIVLFHGFHPFWLKRKYPKLIIGEYHSLSTGSFSRIKDLIKRVFNLKPAFYIFLSEEVRRKLWFSKKDNYLIRGMGYNKKYFCTLEGESKIFDIVYCGSERSGLLPVLKKLADLGMSIALVGPNVQFEHKNITSFGRKSPGEAAKIILKSRIGLNYTPDIFPLNIQDSTKVIEYCAAGLGVITNSYQWVNNFESSRGAKFLYLEEITSKIDIEDFDFIIPDVKDLEWERLIDESGILSKIIEG